MKVSDSNSAQTFEVARDADERLRKLTKTKETELEGIKNIYNKKIEDAKSDGEEHYINALKRNDETLIGASHDYEEKLKSYRENLTKTQKALSSEEQTLRDDHNQKMVDQKEQFLSNIHDQYLNARESQDSIRTQMDASMHSISDKARTEKNHLEMNSKMEVNALANMYNQKGTSEERDFRTKLDADVRAHEEDVRLQKTELKKIIDRDNEKSVRLKAEKDHIQREELLFLDNHQKEMIAQKQKDFQVRYDNLAKEHDAILSNIKNMLDADIKKTIESASTQKRMIANKSDDSFYRVEKLNPSIVDNKTEYIVTMPVAEHEKENVHLSVHDREIKMTLTRRYTDTVEDKDGSTRSTKNELFSREFNTKDLMNSKKVTQKYEDGVLSYRIQKLH